jgi:hypothetical protein
VTKDALPSFIEHPPDAFWEQSPALIPATPVRTVVAAGGFVAAAGDGLHVIRPGAERLRSPAILPGERIAVLAVEPWSPFRLAIAWPGHVGIYSGHRPFDALLDLTFTDQGHDATHLAWARDPEGIKLFVRRKGCEVLRVDPKGTHDALAAPNTMAVAGDESGNVALLADVSEDGVVWIIPAGTTEGQPRSLDAILEPDEDDPNDRFELALHGPAVAYSYGASTAETTGTAEVSWRAPKDEDDDPHFSHPRAVFFGPLAFQSADVVYAAYNVEGQVNVLRWVKGGGVTRIARFGLDDTWEGTPATVTGLAWDEARRALWAASPELGLIRLHAPGAARPQKVPAAAPPPPAGKVSLPHRGEDTWDGGFVLDKAQRIVGVSGAGGLVMGGGDALFLLRPGAKAWLGRDMPEGLGVILAVAAEQAKPFRYAVSSEGGITLFGLPHDQKLTLSAEPGAPVATHLAWGRLGKERVLYLRWGDGGVGRLRLDLGTVEPLSVAPMDAIAADADGVLAMVSLLGQHDDAHALVTADGVRFEERPAIAPLLSLAGEGGVHLAVAGAAVACAVEGWGAYLSRSADDDFVRCEGLLGGGALAFQGTAPSAALFGACHDRTTTAIHRVDAGGAVLRIAEIETSTGEPPRLTALAWDPTRHVLWSASPQAGIMRSEEPAKKGGKKRTLS